MSEHVERSERVSTLELFFDLVFVFTITQVAFIVEHHPGWKSVAQAVLELLLIYWMYGGYAWLTNAIGSTSAHARALLLTGMAAFFVVSLCVPRAFGEDAVVFAIAYLVLNVVHLVGFLTSGVAMHIHSMTRIGSVNLGACALVFAAAYLDGWPRWVLWSAAIALQWIVPQALRWAGGLEVDHFAERHGLMIIIVLGESVVSLAIAAQTLPVTAGLVVGTLSGLALSTALWWLYFAGEDDAAADSFRRVPYAERGRPALVGYDLPHVAMMCGIIGIAAGTRLSLEDLTGPTTTAAAALIAGGAAVYLAGLAAFRAAIGHGVPWPRLAVGVLALAAIPLGVHISTAVELLVLAALLAVFARLEPAPATA